MPVTAKNALDLLEEFRKERDELNSLIQALEKRLGVVSNASDSQIGPSQTPRVTVSIDSIPLGFFHNMSQVAAAEKLLKMNEGHPLSNNEILEAFRKSGMELNPRNASTILYTNLKRSQKFERVAGKAWGLSEWYGEKKKRRDAELDQHGETKE